MLVANKEKDAGVECCEYKIVVCCLCVFVIFLGGYVENDESDGVERVYVWWKCDTEVESKMQGLCVVCVVTARALRLHCRQERLPVALLLLMLLHHDIGLWLLLDRPLVIDIDTSVVCRHEELLLGHLDLLVLLRVVGGRGMRGRRDKDVAVAAAIIPPLSLLLLLLLRLLLIAVVVMVTVLRLLRLRPGRGAARRNELAGIAARAAGIDGGRADEIG